MYSYLEHVTFNMPMSTPTSETLCMERKRETERERDITETSASSLGFVIIQLISRNYDTNINVIMHTGLTIYRHQMGL